MLNSKPKFSERQEYRKIRKSAKDGVIAGAMVPGIIGGSIGAAAGLGEGLIDIATDSSDDYNGIIGNTVHPMATTIGGALEYGVPLAALGTGVGAMVGGFPTSKTQLKYTTMKARQKASNAYNFTKENYNKVENLQKKASDVYNKTKDKFKKKK